MGALRSGAARRGGLHGDRAAIVDEIVAATPAIRHLGPSRFAEQLEDIPAGATQRGATVKETRPS